MPTECNPEPMLFARLDRREVVADFGGGTMTSDAGALLLGATDRAINLVERFAGCHQQNAPDGSWQSFPQPASQNRLPQ